MRAMLVTAGLGTRLAPLTELLPKPAVPVGNLPLAWYALDHLHRAGVREFVLNTHHLPDALERELLPVAPSDARLAFVHEPKILGTGGGVKNAWKPEAGETFAVMNGKVLFSPELEAAMRLHEQSRALVTMVLRPMAEHEPFAPVGIDGEGRVRLLPGMAVPHESERALRRTMYTGLCLLDARVHRDLPDDGCLIRDGFRRLVERGERVMAYVTDESFLDAGVSLAHYHQANMALLAGTVRWPGITPDQDQSLRAPSAQVPQTTRLTQSVVGPHATLAPEIELRRCVVWPGACARHSAKDTVFLPGDRELRVRTRPSTAQARP